MIEKIFQWWPLFLLGFCLYIGAVISTGLGWNPFERPWDFTNTGAFGDSFGPLSMIAATVAAVGAVAAYKAQREELERVKQAAPIERAEAAKRDFENTFFNLLGLLRETVKEVDVTDDYGHNPVHGRDGLTHS